MAFLRRKRRAKATVKEFDRDQKGYVTLMDKHGNSFRVLRSKEIEREYSLASDDSETKGSKRTLRRLLIADHKDQWDSDTHGTEGVDKDGIRRTYVRVIQNGVERVDLCLDRVSGVQELSPVRSTRPDWSYKGRNARRINAPQK